MYIHDMLSVQVDASLLLNPCQVVWNRGEDSRIPVLVFSAVSTSARSGDADHSLGAIH